MLVQPYPHVYLSPHLDDVVLSCGGAIRAQTRARQRVLVVTFFAATPANDEITSFACELKARWGQAPDPVAVRRAEDLAALRVLKADGLHLPYTDCVYRHDPATGEPYYPDEGSIFGDVHPAEAEWHRELLVGLMAGGADLTSAMVYAPLGAGHHVDHLLVRRVGLALLLRGERVLFYEDYPYADCPETLDAALDALPGECWSWELRPFDEADLQAKMGAVACHASQINTFWRDAQGEGDQRAMRRALRAHARAAAEDGYAERFWRLAPACLGALRSLSDHTF